MVCLRSELYPMGWLRLLLQSDSVAQSRMPIMKLTTAAQLEQFAAITTCPECRTKVAAILEVIRDSDTGMVDLTFHTTDDGHLSHDNEALLPLLRQSLAP